MKVLILAAGYATRLYPLTENFPKPLLTVGDKTILDHLVDDIALSGKADEFVVISNGKFFSHFEKWAEGKKEKITVLNDGTYTNETRLGAVCDIEFAIKELNIDDDILVIAGDNILDFSMCRFIDYAYEKNASCVMRYYEPEMDILRKCGVLEIDENDRIYGMEEKPPQPKSHWGCPPFYFYVKKDLCQFKKGIEAGCGTDAPGSFVAYLQSVVPVYAMEMPGKRFDIGDIESYEEVKRTFKGIVK